MENCPKIGDKLSEEQLDDLVEGWCPCCGAGDEYDMHDNSLWYCLNCPAQFSLVWTRRRGYESATRIEDSE